MRVLQVVHQFLPRYVGGTELYVAGLARWLHDQGHQVALLAGGDEAAQGQWEGMPLVTVPGGLRGPKGPTALFATTFGNGAAEGAFQALLAELQPQVVHVHHLVGLSARLPRLAKQAGAAVCATLHDYWFLCPKSQLIDHRGQPCSGPRAGVNCARCAFERLSRPELLPLAPAAAPLFALRQRRVRRAFAACDALFAPSAFLAAVALAAGLPAERVRLVDFGLEAAAHARTVRPAGAPLRVVYLGAIDESKGVHVLLEACRHLDPAQVAVAVYGDVHAAPPDYRARLHALAAAGPYGPGVFRGPLPHQQVPAVLAATDVVAVPSLWYENAPLVITEAFAAGAAVVASRQGALAEKVRDGVDGLLFPRGDAAALAAALRTLAGDAALLARLQAAAPRAASRETHWREVLATYEALAAGPLPPAAALPQRSGI